MNKKEYDKKWQQSKHGKKLCNKAIKKFRITEHGRKQHNEINKKHNKTKKGIATLQRHTAKRRKMNWILMFPNPFAESIKVEYHHINDTYVIALPVELHHLYLGKYHREKTMEIVKQIYLK